MKKWILNVALPGVFCTISSIILSGCVSALHEPFTPQKTEAAHYQTQLGMAYLARGDLPRAKFKLNRALEDDPTWPEAHGAMAYFMEKTQDWEGAEREYRLAVDWAQTRGEHEGESHNNYGVFLCNRSRLDEAEQAFLLAIQDPKYTAVRDAYENLGFCFLRHHDLKQAKVYFLKTLEKDPDSPNAVMGLTTIASEEKLIENPSKDKP